MGVVYMEFVFDSVPSAEVIHSALRRELGSGAQRKFNAIDIKEGSVGFEYPMFGSTYPLLYAAKICQRLGGQPRSRDVGRKAEPPIPIPAWAETPWVDYPWPTRLRLRFKPISLSAEN